MMDLFNSNSLNFHSGGLGQGSDLIGSAGREGSGKELSVNCVHGGKFSNICQQHGGLDHVCHGHAVFFQNCLHVGQALTGLTDDVVAGKFAGGGINGQLTGDIQGVAGSNGLGLGADCSGCIGGVNSLVGHK